tara:strand:+ start:42229 stop:44598 length:2370 start_codon:yes stop_codon:yes gene_type:complete
MLRHNLILFFRNIKRYKSTFAINIIGLSTGLASTFLICLWVYDELNIDKFHEKDDQLFQVMINYHYPDGIVTDVTIPALLGKALEEEMPEVEYTTIVNNCDSKCEAFLSEKDNNIKASGIYAGSNFFKVFSYKLIQGISEQVLTNKNDILLSEELAKKLFGSTKNVVGKTIKGSPELFGETFQVSGIFKSLDSKSSIQFDFIANFELLSANKKWLNDWFGDGTKVYTVVKKGTDIKKFNKKIENYLSTKNSNRTDSKLFLRKYSDAYLYNRYENGAQSGGRIVYVGLFSLVALLILIIACINFTNLSTALASRKKKEILVKKSLGASRKKLIVQFLGESMLMTVIACLLGIVFVILFLPYFNEITGKSLHLSVERNALLFILVATLFTGLASGSYPAFYLSRFNPINIKEKYKNSLEKKIRKGLVVVQFSICVIFIIVAIIINKQIEFTQTKNLGYNKDNIIYFQMKKGYNYKFETFMTELRKVSGVVKATNIYGGSIIEHSGGGAGFSWEGMTPGSENVEYLRLQASYDLIETLGIELIKGRSFSKEYDNEKEKLIINEAAAKMIGSKDIINKTIRDIRKDKQIIGVVKDFNMESLNKEIRPCFIRFVPNGNNVMVKLQKGKEVITINKLEKFYKKFHSGYPFEFTFLDEDYQSLYVSEKRAITLSKYLTGLAILISCLGLFGLATYTAERRRKEIGIRRTLGQKKSKIVMLLSGEFLKLVGIAILIGLPTAFFLMKDWLSEFAYRIDLRIEYFLTTAFLAIFIAVTTVAAQAIRAANRSPIDALREE